MPTIVKPRARGRKAQACGVYRPLLASMVHEPRAYSQSQQRVARVSRLHDADDDREHRGELWSDGGRTIQECWKYGSEALTGCRRSG